MIYPFCINLLFPVLMQPVFRKFVQAKVSGYFVKPCLRIFDGLVSVVRAVRRCKERALRNTQSRLPVAEHPVAEFVDLYIMLPVNRFQYLVPLMWLSKIRTVGEWVCDKPREEI
jgi:hypothetical protein